jgi:DNA-binding NarL/FixJ family response regulator
MSNRRESKEMAVSLKWVTPENPTIQTGHPRGLIGGRMLKSSLPKLSPREQQVLDLCAEGFVDKEIAARLGISPNTVNVYIERILRKTNSRCRGEAISKQLAQIIEAGQVGFEVPITFLPLKPHPRKVAA